MFMSYTIKILISNWPQFNRLLHAGKAVAFDFSHHVTWWSRSSSTFYALLGQNLTGEFMQKMYAASGNLFSDSWSWRSFVSPTCHVFNCLFPLDLQNEFTAGLFIGFVVRNALLVKIIGNPISRGIVFVFHLAWCVRGFKGSSDSGLTWWPSGATSRLVSLSNYCIWCGFFSGFLKSSVG